MSFYKSERSSVTQQSTVIKARTLRPQSRRIAPQRPWGPPIRSIAQAKMRQSIISRLCKWRCLDRDEQRVHWVDTCGYGSRGLRHRHPLLEEARPMPRRTPHIARPLASTRRNSHDGNQHQRRPTAAIRQAQSLLRQARNCRRRSTRRSLARRWKSNRRRRLTRQSRPQPTRHHERRRDLQE